MPVVQDINVHVADNGTVARATFSHLFEGQWYVGALDFVRPRGTSQWKVIAPVAEARAGMHYGDGSNDMCITVVTRVRQYINREHPATGPRRPSIKRVPDYLTLPPVVTPPADFRPADPVTRTPVTRTYVTPTPVRTNPPQYACARHGWCGCNGNPEWC